MPAIIDITEKSKFDAALSSSNISVFYFWAEWALECKFMNEVLDLLSNDEDLSSVYFYRIEAEELNEVSLERDITAVPTVLIGKSNKIISRIDGAKSAELTKLLKNLVTETHYLPELKKSEEPKENLEERLKNLINQSRCVLFMKGDRMNPKCGFSKSTIEILTNANADYTTFDILTDDEVRQGLKKYSNWPTYPQLYLNGELIGGIDIIREMQDSGELNLPIIIDVNEKIRSLLASSPKLFVFMKGSRNSPQCGFSKQLMEILNETGEEFETFDILKDEEIRQGLKVYSNWPTYPQVYVNSELIGGLDIIKELKESNQLISTLKGE